MEGSGRELPTSEKKADDEFSIVSSMQVPRDTHHFISE